MGDPLDGCSEPGCDGDPFDKGVLGERGAFKGRPLCRKHYERERRAGKTKGRAAANRDTPIPPHGTVSRYRSRVHTCRCRECKAAATAKKREERRG